MIAGMISILITLILASSEKRQKATLDRLLSFIVIQSYHLISLRAAISGQKNGKNPF